MPDLEDHEEQLDSFDLPERRRALAWLSEHRRRQLPPEGTNVNMHAHSFFSFNARDWSPAHIAWEARKAGLYAAGLCDFDVLDGLEEFLQAGQVLGLRTAVHLETRAYLREYADKEINSPGEPGVTYVMGAGFARAPAPGTPAAAGLSRLRERAGARNQALVGRINAALPEIAIDCEQDVLPLTPGGAATERHIVRAYIKRSERTLQHPDAVARYWSSKLGRNAEEVVELLADPPLLEEAVRARLVKRGGLGYEQPSPASFPPVDEFLAWARSCAAIPTITWLDGTSAGERDGRAMLECMEAKGAAALNIIPDRNWNVADAAARAVKVRALAAIVAAAEALHLPINIGTELNKEGQPGADDLDGEVLRAHRRSFLRGARIMVGHTTLLRYAGFSYVGAEAAAEFPDRSRRNGFFESVGALPAVDPEGARRLEDLGPEKALAWLREAAGRQAAAG